MTDERPGCVEAGCVFLLIVVGLIVAAVLVATLDRAGELILDLIDSVEIRVR